MKFFMAVSDNYESVVDFCANADQAELQEGLEDSRHARAAFVAASVGALGLAALSTSVDNKFGMVVNAGLALMAGVGSHGFHNNQKAIEAEQTRRLEQ